jgi:uncharacterized protein YxjI
MNNLSKQKAVTIETRLFGNFNIFELKDKNNQTLGNVKLVSSSDFTKGFSIFGTGNKLILRVQGYSSSSARRIAKIFDSVNKLLAKVKIEGSIIGKSKAIVSDSKGKKIFEISAVSMPLNLMVIAAVNFKIYNENQIIAEVKTKRLSLKKPTTIKLKHPADMRIVVASFIQFLLRFSF